MRNRTLEELERAASGCGSDYLANLLWWAVAEIRKLRKQVRTLKQDLREQRELEWPD